MQQANDTMCLFIANWCNLHCALLLASVTSHPLKQRSTSSLAECASPQEKCYCVMFVPKGAGTSQSQILALVGEHFCLAQEGIVGFNGLVLYYDRCFVALDVVSQSRGPGFESHRHRYKSWASLFTSCCLTWHLSGSSIYIYPKIMAVGVIPNKAF